MENKWREAYLAMEIPDMKAGIMAAIGAPGTKRVRRRIRPAAAVVMALLFLSMLMGAAAGGSLLLRDGSRYYLRDGDGNIVKPNGFHMDEGADVQLSEKALANIAPYVFSSGDPATLYETADREEMETFLDLTMRLPAAADDASLYRMWACGADGEAASIFVQIQLTGEWADGSIDVSLRNSPLNILTASTPEMYEYALSDGTPVSIAAYKTMSGMRGVSALYMHEGAVYHIALRGDHKADLLDRLRTMLDTVQ